MNFPITGNRKNGLKALSEESQAGLLTPDSQVLFCLLEFRPCIH